MNTLYFDNSINVLNKLKEESIDMVITSPPYDNLRSYNNCKWNFEIFKDIAKGLKRVLKKGGCIVWIVNDATIKGTETGSSFKQALYFKEIGLRLHDTMIWNKHSSPYPSGKNSVRYTSIFEYMFILSKGKPKTINLIMDKVNKYGGKKGTWVHKDLMKNETRDECKSRITSLIVNKYGVRNNIWDIGTYKKDKNNHPAIYPEELVRDHIKTWSNKGDIILDCFAGSGTTLKVSSQMDRQFIGIEINEKYIEIIKDRLKKYNIKYSLII